MSKSFKKGLVIAVIFILTFVNYGFSLEAIATEGMSFFESSIFKKSSMNLEAYYDDNDDNSKSISKISNVNETVDITVELKQKTEGFLKNGKLSFNLENGDENNFRIVSVGAESDDMENIQVAPISSELTSEFTTNSTTSELTETLKSSTEFVKDNESSESSETTKNSESSEKSTNTADFQTEENNTDEESEKNVTEKNVKQEALEENNAGNEVEKTTSKESKSDVEEKISDTEDAEEQEAFVDEEKVIETATQEAVNEKAILQLNNEVEVTAENEITLQNILGDVVLHITIEYKNSEEINIDDLYGKINVNLEGTYINTDLKEVNVAESDSLTLGWNYSKDVEITSEYIKMAPFSLGEINGTIVENEISVKREIEEENYLPIKEEKIKIKVPELNGEMPTAVSITANKLMASKGEEFGNVNFDESNWNYDEENGTVEITITNENNGKAVVTSGEDNFIVTYRYEKYIEESTELSKDVEVTVEEYSSNSNNIQTKNIKEEQIKEIDSGELITYSVGTTEDKINKGTINANYYSEEKYETEFTTIVNLNLLTSDMLDEIIIKGTKETYEDKRGNTFDASDDVMYKGVTFNYQEIKSMLEKGSTIDLLNGEGEIVYTLTEENTTSNGDCKITFIENVKGLQVRINKVETDGNIGIEFTKVIGQSKYIASAFSEFSKIRSTVRAHIKYVGMEEEFSLKELETEKSFSDSYTRANLSMNKDSLTTIENNENVELKIELNNNVETSDLYKNPSFELVFPKYVTNVDIEGMNLINADGLRVSDFQTYTKDGIVRVKIELEGTQTGFSTGTLTNGTNIIINTNIEVDDVTPRKEDQIKLYYCNEAVTNYESQTKWTISKNIPNEIIKQTNGFDVAVFEFQAPTGMVAISSVRNYDGNSSEIKSVKQGDVVAKVEREKDSQIASVGITTLNNTGNECMDLSIVGRIPFKGNKTVTSNDDLGTTVTAPMIDYIKADSSNSVSSKIYYSTNETANKNLNDSSNGWTENVESLSEVRSYLIVVDGTVEAGETLNYTYDVEIPENLPYEAEMYSTFSVYYNNNSDVAVVYESITADKVGVYTEAGPRVESSLSVNIGDGADVQEGRILEYTVTVRNTGTVSAQNITVNVKKPSYTVFTEFKVRGDIGEGDYAGYYDTIDEEENFTIDSLEPGEIQEVSFMLKVATPLTKIAAYDEDGNLLESVVDEDQDYTVSVQANINVENLSIESTTNTVTNKIVKAKIITDVFADYLTDVYVGYKFPYIYKIRNISGSDINNLKVVCKIPKEFKYEKLETQFTDMECKSSFDEETNTLTITIPHLDDYEDGVLNIYVNAINGTETKVTPKVTYNFKDGTTESGQTLPTEIKGAIIQAKLVNQTESSEVLEGDKVEYKVRISNAGKYAADKVEVKLNISKNLDDVSAYYIATAYGMVSANIEDGEGTLIITNLAENQDVDIIIEGTAKSLDKADGNKINNTIIASYVDIERARMSTNEITIKENPNKVEEDTTNNNSRPIDYDEEDINSDNSNNSNNNNNSNNSNNNDNSNNDNNGNNSDNNNNATANTAGTTTTANVTYTISGYAWVDENKNGQKEDDEQALTGIEVQLYEGSEKVKTTQTNINGRYIFTSLSAGTYSVHFVYNGDKYVTTTYKKTGVDENANSDAVELSSGYSSTNNITIENSNIENLNIGLQYKDTVDFTIQKVIKSAKVTTKKGEKTYEFKDLELAKFEISSKEWNGATVELVYQINVTNNGNAEGQVTQVIDCLPKDTTLATENNDGWYVGNDGNAYNDSLKDVAIVAGETKTLNITLVRTMAEESTGILVNKVVIASTYNKLGITENTDNNTATQETIISVATGYIIPITIFIIFAIVIFIISKLVITKKIKIDIKAYK
jgi:uncharacterized repeat protein (TIGR01451 family)